MLSWGKVYGTERQQELAGRQTTDCREKEEVVDIGG